MIRLTTLVLLAFASITPVQAALVNADWMNDGDNKAVIDLDNGRMWLGLTETMGMSIRQVEAQLSTTFRGFRLASKAEIQAMLVSAFSGFHTPYEDHFDDETFRSQGGHIYTVAGGNAYSDAHTRVSDYFGSSTDKARPYSGQTDVIYSLGLYKTGDVNTDGTDGIHSAGVRKAYNQPQSQFSAYIHYDNYDTNTNKKKDYWHTSDTNDPADLALTHYGVWLTQETHSVPTPPTSIAMLLLLAWALNKSKRRARLLTCRLLAR
jgi:hypothetical protein